MFKKKPDKKTASNKIEKNFIHYRGHVPELNLFSHAGYWFKVYLPDKILSNQKSVKCFDSSNAFIHHTAQDEQEHLPGIHKIPELNHLFGDETFITNILHVFTFKFQLIASKNQIYVLFGIKADIPEEADAVFQKFEQSFPYPSLTCDEWFELLANRLRFESFSGLMEERKGKKRTKISLVQPYKVKNRQKELELSGRTVKTAILMGYPSTIFPAFATELLEIADNLTLVVFAEEIDAKKCLDGIHLSKSIRTARRETMLCFLNDIIEKNQNLYNTCVLAAIDGLPGETEETFERLRAYCKKYLISVSELDYQQADAWKSTLPLLENRIHYHRVFTEKNLTALLPWSALKTCKKNIFYGKDKISGKIEYDRRTYQENGVILSSNYLWAIEQAKKEIEAYRMHPCLENNSISILVDENTDISLFEPSKSKQITLNYEDTSDSFLRDAVIWWAVCSLSTNGQTMKRHVDQIKKASAIPFEEDYLEKFLAGMGESEQRALRIRPFTASYDYRVMDSRYGKIYQVQGKGIHAELGYFLCLLSLHGLVYSINSELLVKNWIRKEINFLHPDTLYTFLSQDNHTLYESRRFEELLKQTSFMLIGEHKIAEKLKLAEQIKLNKEQRDWISEPAKGSVLITKLVSYQLIGSTATEK